jgi:hypothetical protein
VRSVQTEKARYCARFHIPGGFTRDFRLNLAGLRCKGRLSRAYPPQVDQDPPHRGDRQAMRRLYRSLPIDDIREQTHTKIEGSSQVQSPRLDSSTLKKGGGGSERCLLALRASSIDFRKGRRDSVRSREKTPPFVAARRKSHRLQPLRITSSYRESQVFRVLYYPSLEPSHLLLS